MGPMLSESEEARIARGVVGQRADFPNPFDIAKTAGIVLVATQLPQECPAEMTDGSTVYYRPHPDRRELGTRLFRGIAAAILERTRGPHTPADVSFLAARLAAPPHLVQRVGIDQAIERQRWMTDRFLRAWWASM